MKILILTLVGFFLALLHVQSQSLGPGNTSPFVLQGYVKEMPALQLNRNFSDPDFSNITHNRLNFRWNIDENLYFSAQGRNRLFYNEILRDYPFYKDILDQDPGLIDMSWIWLSEGPWIGHTNVDRLYLDWQKNNWQIRAGRQRINWGKNLVSNPNDLFNTYSFFDFDYRERPGADALRVQYYTGFASRVEIAYSPANKLKESTSALLWATNYKGYDIQVLAGYYKNRSALGLGWAGSIGGAGFKGEATWFYDLEETPGIMRGNIVAATGIDFMFGSGTFAVLEFLYNGGYGRLQEGISLITQPLQADNIMFSEFAVTFSAQHPFSSVFQGGLALMALPDIEAAFIMPSVGHSLVKNLDFEFVSQIFIGGKDSVFEEAGSSWYLSLQYSF